MEHWFEKGGTISKDDLWLNERGRMQLLEKIHAAQDALGACAKKQVAHTVHGLARRSCLDRRVLHRRYRRLENRDYRTTVLQQ